MTTALTLGILAARLDARVAGAFEDVEIRDLALLSQAGPDSLPRFYAERTSLHRLLISRAAAILVDCVPDREVGAALLVHPSPALCLARAARWLPVRVTPAARGQAIDPEARIDATARIGADVALGAGTVVGAGSEIGARARIGAFCTIGSNVRIEADSELGNRCRVAPGCLIGGDGFVYVDDGVAWLQVPSFGNVQLADEVVLGPACVVDRGVGGSTRLGRGVILDGCVHVGHDAAIGANSIIAGGVSIAGAATIGARCRIGGRSAIGEGVSVADRVTITGMSMVSRSIEQPGGRWSSGWPAQPSVSWWRTVARARRGPPAWARQQE